LALASTALSSTIAQIMAAADKGPMPVIPEVESISPEQSNAFKELMKQIKSKLDIFSSDTAPSKFARDSCDDLFTSCTAFVKVIGKILYSGKAELVDLATEGKGLFEKLLNQCNSFISFYSANSQVYDFKQSVVISINSFCGVLEFIHDIKSTDRKDIEVKLQEANRNVQRIISIMTGISAKFRQEHADAEKKMEEENSRLLAQTGGKTLAEIRLEEEVRQEREHQIRVLKLEKELQREKEKIEAQKRAKFEAGQL